MPARSLPFASLLERLDQLDAQSRAYALNNLPFHLDQAEDPRATERLLELARSGFPQLKAERIADVAQSNLDYRYYFRASLRAGSLPVALELAPSQGGLTQLADWLTSGILANMLRHLGPQSRLWQQVRSAIEALGSPTARVEQLTVMHRPGLDPSMYAWLRRDFDRNACEARDSARTDFLAAVAAHERGAIQYILDRSASAPPDVAFAKAVFENLEALCEGTHVTLARALDQLTVLVRKHSDAFVAAADTLISMPAERAAIGLAAFEATLPTIDDDCLALQIAATVAHGWWRCGEGARAEILARRCLTMVPPQLADDTFRELYADSFIDASARLLLAAAPFDELWRRARAPAEDLASRGTWPIHRAESIAGFLRALPWIASPQDRLEWLAKTLDDVRELLASDLDCEGFDVMSIKLAIAWGRPMDSSSPRHFRLQPVEQALFEVLQHIDEVLVSERALDPLLEIVTATLDVHFDAHRAPEEEDEDEGQKSADHWSQLAKQLLCAAGASRNVRARILVFKCLLPLLSNHPEALTTLSATLPNLIDGVDASWTRLLADKILTLAEQHCCTESADLLPLLAYAAITAVSAGRQHALFESVQARLSDWIKATEHPEDADALRISWAAALIALGRAEDGRALLMSLASNSRSRRLTIARELLRSQAPQMAADLLHADLPASIALDEVAALDEPLTAARLLLLARHDVQARELLLSTAREYRSRAGELDAEVAAALLNAFHDLQDAPIVTALLREAESELLRSRTHDAAMASYWYVALALSATGEVEAGHEAWGRLNDWKQQHEREQVRRRAIQVAARPDSPTAVHDLLAAVRRLDEDQPSMRARTSLCRLLTRTQPVQQARLAEGLLEIARDLGQASSTVELLEGVCQTLTGAGAEASLIHSVADRVLEIIAAMTPRESDSLTGMVRALCELLASHSLSADARFEEIVYPILAASARPTDAWSQALPLSGDLMAVLVACEPVPPPERYALLHAVLSEAVTRQSTPASDAVLTRLIDSLDSDDAGDPAVLVALAGAFSVAQRIATPERLADIESHVRRLGPPQPTAARVQWAASLSGTGLDTLAKAALTDLSQNLDRFTERPRDLQMLGTYLRVVAPQDDADLYALYDAVSAWVAHMPLVTNEDWRHAGFEQILRATSDIRPPQRAAIQRMILQRAFEALSNARQTKHSLARALVWLPLDTDVARDAISMWLQSEDRSAFEATLDLLLESLRYGAREASPAGIDAFLERIADGSPAGFRRESAARAAFETDYAPLRSRLSTLLLDDYERRGMASLEPEDLNFLTDQPLEWWVERSPQLGISNSSINTLMDWIKRFIERAPDASWWAVTLATEWLSRSKPEQVREFWFELCLLPSWFPEDTRAALIAQLH